MEEFKFVVFSGLQGTMGDGTPFAPAQLRQIQVEAQKLHKSKSGSRLTSTDRPDGPVETSEDK